MVSLGSFIPPSSPFTPPAALCRDSLAPGPRLRPNPPASNRVQKRHIWGFAFGVRGTVMLERPSGYYPTSSTPQSLSPQDAQPATRARRWLAMVTHVSRRNHPAVRRMQGVGCDCRNHKSRKLVVGRSGLQQHVFFLLLLGQALRLFDLLAGARAVQYDRLEPYRSL